jgi:hypothetical protein
MKKIILSLGMLVSGSVFAQSATIEYQNAQGVNGTANSNLYQISVSENINKNFSAGVVLNTAERESTGAVNGSRAEIGGTGRTQISVFSPYVRLATGQRFTTTTNFSYYSVEPGISAPVGKTRFTGHVAWRYRNAYDSAANADETKTWRAGLRYDITKKNAVGVRYDQVRGDTNQNTWAFNYTRRFN